MIDFECPHCKRVLKIADQHAGEEGACSHCGGRITAPGGDPNKAAASPDSPVAESDVAQLEAHIALLESQLDRQREDFQRLAKDLAAERAARIEAEAARDVALMRIRHHENAGTDGGPITDEPGFPRRASAPESP